MADYVSRATGNFTTLATWRNIGTGTRAKQVSHSASTNTTTSNVYNADAQDHTVANTLVIEGVMMFCNRVNTTGTVDVVYSQDSGTTATRTVTVNASDLPQDPSWVFFKFGSTLTADGGTDYAVGIRGSSAGNATFFRDATASNWSHIVVLNSSPASLVAGDVFWVVGELTGAGTGNDITVTMDSTATTDYGTGTDGLESNGMDIGKRGIVTYGTTASTNYYLKMSGSVVIWGDGVLNIGTSATPIPRTSTAVLEIEPVADGGMGLIVKNGGTLTMQGLSRTSGKNIYYCLLNTDEASSQTTLGVDRDTGWLNGDDIAIASTSTTRTEAEMRTLNANANASDMTVSSGLTNAHSGTAPTQAEVILLTRNVKFRSASSTIMTFVNVQPTRTVVDIDWAEFRYIGANTSAKRGLEVDTSFAGTFDCRYSAFRDSETWGLYINSSATVAVNAPYNVFYNMNTSAGSATGGGLNNNDTGYTNPALSTYDECIVILVLGATNYGIQMGGYASYNNCRVASSDWGIRINILSGMSGSTMLKKTASGLISHSNNQGGFLFSSDCYIKLSGCYSWNNLTSGLVHSTLGNGDTMFFLLVDCVFQGNTTADIDISSFGTLWQMWCENCKFGSSTEVTNQGRLFSNDWLKGGIWSTRHDQTDGSHKTFLRYGTIQTDSTFYKTASPSERLTPLSASAKLESGSKKVAVNSGETVTISAWVRESETGDGAIYNGARARLILKANSAMGISADTVIDTATASSDGAWEQLTGTTSSVPRDGVLEFVVDCDGTVGWINVDDWSAS